MKRVIKYLHKPVLLGVFLLMSPFVFAATDDIPWTVYLFAMVVISLVMAVMLSKGNKTTEGLTVKIFLGAFYFWLITFVQLIVLGVVYHFNS